ncbi:MAG: hypothetical protein MUF69_09755 [Desulfobacterota bacterium]|nr:hypothetical protein [Thermodesulfobacteriota bacterium]
MNPEPDPYLKKIRKYWDAITQLHLAYADRAPMIEFDVTTGRILVYPAKEYLDDLTDRTRGLAKEQYRKAVAEGALMIFVRDKTKRVLRSYVFPPARRVKNRADF